MKKFKAHQERKHEQAIVRPRVEIEDPSAELLSLSRPWDRDEQLEEVLDQPEVPQPQKDYYRVPKLKYRTTPHISSQYQTSDSQTDESGSQDGNNSPITRRSSQVDWDSAKESDAPEVVVKLKHRTEPPSLPSRQAEHKDLVRTRSRSLPANAIPARSRSLPPTSRETPYQLVVSSPPKTNFQLFSQRCAPSPTSTSPQSSQIVFELAADETVQSIASAMIESPVELEGSPVDTRHLAPPPLQVHSKQPPEYEPEASPYNRFTAFAKSIHALNANLSPIAETEEEAASRRSSTVCSVYELPAVGTTNPVAPSAYSGGTTISPRNTRYTISNKDLSTSAPSRHYSTRSISSDFSTNSWHSMFSFEFSNSDTEKIYISAPMDRRESSAPSLTSVSSIDDFDIDDEIDPEKRQSRMDSKRDTKLERFFGIRQYSVGSESDSSLSLTEKPDISPPESRRSSPAPSHKHSRSATSIDDLDIHLMLETDPEKRQMMAMHKSLLSKGQAKTDAKLEKFFGANKDEIHIARKSSTGPRLLGSNDDLKYRSIGW